MQRTAPANSSSGAQLAISWLFVGLPLAWGIFVTLKNATKLF